MNNSMATPDLAVTRHRLVFEGAADTSGFAGNHWRGAFGHSLRQRACQTEASSCVGCPQLAHCDYAYLFDTPIPPDAAKMRLYREAPHPYTLHERSDTENTGNVTVELRLFGRAAALHRVALMALLDAAQGPRGIGGRVLRLRELPELIAPEAEPPAWHPGHAVSIELLSPLRIKRAGQPLGPQQLSFADFFGNLLRRISLLTAFHSDVPLETDFRGLIDAARQIDMSATLQWIEQRRHSARQQAQVPMGGLTGWLHLPAQADLAPFWPYLWLGQLTQVGAGASMGLGRYQLHFGS